MNFYCVIFLCGTESIIPANTTHTVRKEGTYDLYRCIKEIEAYTANDALLDFKTQMKSLGGVEVAVPDDRAVRVDTNAYKVLRIKCGTLHEVKLYPVDEDQ